MLSFASIDSSRRREYSMHIHIQAAVILWALSFSSTAEAFMPSSLQPISIPLNSPQYQSGASRGQLMFMARQGKSTKRGGPAGRGGGKGNPKNKKKGGSNKGSPKGNKKSKKKQPNANASAASHKPSAHLPPWQIMSAKDAKENIESEIQRREGIRQGHISSSVTSLDEKSGDVNASSSLLARLDRQLFNWKRFRPERDIVSMTFKGAYLGSRLPPKLGVPEVAFLGRSNVGKSSLLNKLSKRASDATNLDAARVGKTPGATASVNLYSLEGKKKDVNKPLIAFADLPGFGYAKLSKDVKESVEMAAERYLGKRRELALGILLVDVRRTPSDDDRAVLAALYDLGVPLLVVATKVDKIRSTNALYNQLEEVRIGLGLPQGQPFCISSVTGEGVKQLWSIIMDACEDKVYELKAEMESGGKSPSEDDAEAYGNIQLDEQGNFIKEDVSDEGYEWIQSFAYHDDSKVSSEGIKEHKISEESRRKMLENEEMQAEQNLANKVKHLKKVARKMQREGKL